MRHDEQFRYTALFVMTPNTHVIDRFYAAFAAHDGAAMAACYAPDATFSDPVFQNLRGAEPGAMWRMLVGRSSDLHVELLDRQVDDDTGSAHWRARYTFAQTGRPVVNEVRSRFHFAAGLIARQKDDFDFYRWTRQALGVTGLVLGWTPLVQGQVRGRARAALDEYMAGGG